MIRIHLGPLTLARTRIAISPLNESVAALELLHRYGSQAPWPYTEWARRAWEILRTVPQVAALHVHLHLAEAGRGQRTPDVFEPMPEVSEPELGQELDALRETPRELVEVQFATHWPGSVPDFLVSYQRDHVKAFAALANAPGCLRRWWSPPSRPRSR
ncbi:hypothetical protein [Actinokineospora globicatena]|uniref:hypothetical protein n=1 Tax=Actinokineospora globicatena TaxID=103729 RepID=UPI0020A46440|nr:hypothetical protein [Actinokineospora globicatena]MCP2304591.1 hypothetical protein [Actinokineospora globicatena]GLW78038.1 hypothetical protein Aglo01_25200 [Actinokineospora globicatena]GLW85296.1 hypothetical protein Aglo02_29360 [Actinokineospora globicatena]